MELPYLKIEPEGALKILDECIVSGYRVKDKITEQYFSNKDKANQLISNWKQLAIDWAQATIDKLAEVFVSTKELYNFRDARPSPIIQINTNRLWNGIINKLEAQINKLNEYDKNIHERFRINVTVVGRDYIYQQSGKGSIKINNSGE